MVVSIRTRHQPVRWTEPQSLSPTAHLKRIIPPQIRASWSNCVTRKTTPGQRYFEKRAVTLGGGKNHRMGLYDMVMLKDNHIDFAGGISQAIRKTLKYLQKNEMHLKIEIEARNLDEVKQILAVGGIDRIMLDNFSFEDTRKAVELIDGQFETESSGGITLETIRDYAECGVDYVSVGALTHHIKGLDMSLKAVDFKRTF